MDGEVREIDSDKQTTDRQRQRDREEMRLTRMRCSSPMQTRRARVHMKKRQ